MVNFLEIWLKFVSYSVITLSFDNYTVDYNRFNIVIFFKSRAGKFTSYFAAVLGNMPLYVMEG